MGDATAGTGVLNRGRSGRREIDCTLLVLLGVNADMSIGETGIWDEVDCALLAMLVGGAGKPGEATSELD